MHEDKEEALMQMFPKGYIIIYIPPNNETAISWYNPENHPVITGGVQIINEEFGGKDYGPDYPPEAA